MDSYMIWRMGLCMGILMAAVVGLVIAAVALGGYLVLKKLERELLDEMEASKEEVHSDGNRG